MHDHTIERSINKPIKAGDQISRLLGSPREKRIRHADRGISVYGRAPGTAPYTSIAQSGFKPGPDWKMVEVSGKASRNYPAVRSIFIYLATAKQTADFGPVIVLDLGPGA